MKILAENIFKSFSVLFCLQFIRTKGNTTQHPKFGLNELTREQFENSPESFKQEQKENILSCINKEIQEIQAGNVGDMSSPLVGGEYVKMLYKYAVDGSHDLNKRLKYPELMEIVDDIEPEKKRFSPSDITLLVNERVKNVKSKMPYKAQFVFECLGYEV